MVRIGGHFRPFKNDFDMQVGPSDGDLQYS